MVRNHEARLLGGGCVNRFAYMRAWGGVLGIASGSETVELLV